MIDKIVRKYGQKVGYSEAELATFKEGGHRVRLLTGLMKAAPLYVIEAEVVEAKHCNTGYRQGQKFVLDVAGNFITDLCPKSMCVYLVSQLALPIALINERLSEGLDPNDFFFMRKVKCPDTGVDCLGYGEVMLQVRVVPKG